LPKGAAPDLIEVLHGFKRQALHATRLGLVHPTTRQSMVWDSAPPQDFRDLLEVLERDMRSAP
jgi:23S rRNA pseudouridine1911/1915/1917 synthase